MRTQPDLTHSISEMNPPLAVFEYCDNETDRVS